MASEAEDIMEYIDSIWRELERLKKEIMSLWDAVTRVDHRIAYHEYKHREAE